MAENQEDRSSDDLTEEASPYRLEEYRQKGMVSQSKEVSALLALVAAAATCYVMAPSMGATLGEYMKELLRTDWALKQNLSQNEVLGGIFGKVIKTILVLGLPIAFAGFVMGALSSFAQVGSIFSLDPLEPDFSRISPLKGISRLIARKHFIDSAIILAKMTAIIIVCYGILKTEIFNAPGFIDFEPTGQFFHYGRIAKSLFLSSVLVLAVFAVLDFWVNKWDYMKNLRMTKEEAKQEHKEREGDPKIKARIRSIQREMARRRMMAAVKKADVIVTNPTHIAVALVYDKDKMAAPKVVAKGADFIAQKIKKIAADAGVPLVENVPLARTLFKTVKVGHGIPKALYQAVAEVLAYVYRLKGRGV